MLRSLATVLLAAAAPAARARATTLLNASSFDGFVGGHDVTVVFFFVPWCGHSRELLPTYERAADQVRAALEASESARSCGFAKLDASEDEQIAARYGIEGYPTLLLLHTPRPSALGGAVGAPAPREFRGERTTAAIAAWALNQLEPRLPVVRSVAEARALLHAPPGAGVGGPVVAAAIALIPPGHAPALLSAVRLAAAELNSIPWVHCPSADAADIGRELAHGEGGDPLALPALVVLRAADGGAAVLPLGPWDGPESGWEVPQSGGFAAPLYAQSGASGDGAASAGVPSGAAHRLGAHLAEWADAHALPFLMPYTASSAEMLFGTRADFYALLIHAGPTLTSPVGQRATGSDGADALPAAIVRALREAADGGLRGSFAFATVAAADFPEIAEYVGLIPAPTAAADGAPGASTATGAPVGWPALPALAVLQPSMSLKWAFALGAEGGTAGGEAGATAGGAPSAGMRLANPAQLNSLLAQIRHGALAPSLRSAPPLSPPPQPVAGRVTEIVGSSFEAVVLQPSWHVLVYVYSPWCGHCLRFNGTLGEIAAELQPIESLVIVALDGTANELPGLPVGAYPSLFLYAKGRKDEPVEFTGARSRTAVTHFVLAELGEDESVRLARSAEADWRQTDGAAERRSAQHAAPSKVEL
ncbi:hypothetical protein KFE25_003289 [Diacronema lutheri]|uniref:protein disulfide-isomerase n=3 Tax=Diacronema lutheri TaxID=2081491 RepID=A0A8J6CAM0_DIALT|nr:hypothetical protein KFE25_003289 [Diacronema lutheri]